MKLKWKEFEGLAKQIGYKSGGSYFRSLFGQGDTYSQLKNGNSIGFEMVRVLYNAIGKENINRIIDFEQETLESFRSKFIIVNDILF